MLKWLQDARPKRTAAKASAKASEPAPSNPPPVEAESPEPEKNGPLVEPVAPAGIPQQHANLIALAVRRQHLQEMNLGIS